MFDYFVKNLISNYFLNTMNFHKNHFLLIEFILTNYKSNYEFIQILDVNFQILLFYQY